jgi:Flp pilus assembly protein TadD
LEYAHHEDPALPGVATLLGMAQARTGQWDEAEKSFEAAIRQNPADARALDGLAALALRRKDYEAAAHRALEALERDMHLSRAHLHLGVALWRLNRVDAAAEALATCARLDPHRPAPLYLLSRLARARGDAVSAERYRKSARAEAKLSS